MGPPINGSPLSWYEVRNIRSQARKWAAEQLLGLWQAHRQRVDSEPLWGDEIEYTVVALDGDSRHATVALDQERILEEWAIKAGELDSPNELPILQPEWASYMVEGVPAKPFCGDVDSLLGVERDMVERRRLIADHLGQNHHLVTITMFPRLGVCGQFTTPYSPPSLSGYHSCMLPVELRSHSSRAQLMERNLLSRRQAQLDFYIPIFEDKNTPRPFYEPLPPTQLPNNKTVRKNCVYLDGQGYSGGSCCIQTTFQAKNETEARWLHDQLIPLGPVMLALTAATPAYKGYLVDTDTRWKGSASATDCRTTDDVKGLPPRFSATQTYISQDPGRDTGNVSLQLPVDQEILQYLLDRGMDEPLATHYAYVFSRDPLFLTRPDIDDVDLEDTNLFHCFQNGVWQHVRFKPPPTRDSSIGWRVEFRPMEVQLKDLDNAAVAIFMYLLSQAIMNFHLNFYVPLELVNESMESAHRRDGALTETFWFRQRRWASDSFLKTTSNGSWFDKTSNDANLKASAYSLMTLNEIINGQANTAGGFPGLVPIVIEYLRWKQIPLEEQEKLCVYLDVISKRASGDLPTPARWIRDFVAGHDDYQHDSIITEAVCHDLMQKIVSINA